MFKIRLLWIVLNVNNPFQAQKALLWSSLLDLLQEICCEASLNWFLLQGHCSVRTISEPYPPWPPYPPGIAAFQRVKSCPLLPFGKSGPYVSFFSMWSYIWSYESTSSLLMLSISTTVNCLLLAICLGFYCLLFLPIPVSSAMFIHNDFHAFA